MNKQLPILMSTPLVFSTIDGLKTETRRIVKPRHLQNDNVDLAKCPYGQPGDILWVREAWKPIGWDFEDGIVRVKFKDGTTTMEVPFSEDNDLLGDRTLNFMIKCSERMHNKGVEYDNGEDEDSCSWSSDLIDRSTGWRPSIHMPKNFARIWLEVTDVKLQRLQDITEEEAKAEGVKKGRLIPHGRIGETSYTEGFYITWLNLHGSSSVIENPLVWAITYKVLSTTGKPENL